MLMWGQIKDFLSELEEKNKGIFANILEFSELLIVRVHGGAPYEINNR